jgi:23S rRNA pseudouridine2605 synthase
MKRKTDNFSKFFTRKSNGAIKEAIKQEKKAEKKARKEAIERHFEKKREAKAAREGFNQAHDAHSTPRKGSGAIQSKKPPFSGKPGKAQETPGNASGKFQAQGSAGKNQAPDKFSSTGKHSVPQEGHHAHSPSNTPTSGDLMPLNKYIAHSGICSRRDAAELIRQGKVLVNGQLVTEPGTKVAPADYVKVNGKKVTITNELVYVLLNKPKDYITTTDDPQGRKTVLDLIRHATTERVYPVGRLDRNTSGVLLLTNDGELAQKLAHPKHEIKKIYHVTLDKVLTKGDFDKIINGEVILEDGPAYVDVIAYADSRDKTQVGLEIHSGRNRIVRRIFEHLGYDVRGLDRVMYAGLTKKNVQRGKWRLLTEKEIRILKYLNSSFKRTPSTGGEQELEKQGRKIVLQGKQGSKFLPAEADDLDDPEGLMEETQDSGKQGSKKQSFEKQGFGKQGPGKSGKFNTGNTGSPARAKAKGPFVAKGERPFIAKGERSFISKGDRPIASGRTPASGRNQAASGRKPAPLGRNNQSVSGRTQASGGSVASDRSHTTAGRTQATGRNQAPGSSRNQAPGSGRKPSPAGGRSKPKSGPGRNQAAPGGRPARPKGRNAKM